MKQQLYSELRTIYETAKFDPHTFRITVKLKDLIDGDVLKNAVEKTSKRYPYFCVRMISEGDKLFFETNPAPIPVLVGNERTVLGSEETSGHLLAFRYWKNRLYIEIFHGLTDGGGIAPLIKTLLYYYLSDYYKIEFPTDGIRLAGEEIGDAEWEDPGARRIPDGTSIVVPKWNKKAIQLGDAGIAHLTPDSVVYNVRISEEEFMRFNISNDGSPATIVSLLLARTVSELHPDSALPPVIAMCVNQRKAIRAPMAHQSLVGDVRLPYTNRMKGLSFTEQATCFRGMVSLQSNDDMVWEEIRDYQNLMKHLETLKTNEERREFCFNRMNELSRCLTASVSYVGKANLGDFERYIQEYEVLPSTVLPSTHVPLSIEMSAMNGYFFLNFMQFFPETDYFLTFISQLRKNNINYDVLNVTEARYPRMELPF